MKFMKKAAVFALGAAVLVSAAGCGAPKRSGQFKLNYKELVPEVCDYKKIPVTFSADYSVKDEDVEETITNLMIGYGIGTTEVTDRDIVEKTDLVLVDYTGYLDGKAFDRGADTDVMLDVARNSDTSGTTFIDGFTDGLVGAKVGTTVKSDVTFPEKYDNAELAGKQTTFEFKVKAIHRTISYKELSDEMVQKTFGSFNVSTVKELVDFVKNYLQSSADSKIYSETVNGIRDYILENSKINIPEDYLQLRIKEYEQSMEEDYCTEGQSLEDYITANYDMTFEEAVEEWTGYMETQVKTELAVCRIAELEKITIDEDGYNSYVRTFVENTSYSFADENAVYQYFGSGNVKEGKTYLRQLYLVNKTLDSLVPNAEITYDIKEDKDKDTEK